MEKNSRKRQNAKLPQESIDNLRRPTNIKGIEFVVKTFLSCFHKESSSPRFNWCILPDIQGGNNVNSNQLLPGNSKGGHICQFLL